MKVKTYRILTDQEFDALVKRVYGEHVRYEFVADEEAHNYSSYTYNNIVVEEIDDYNSNKLAGLVIGDPKSCSFMARTIIQDMVNNKVLDPGNYMVEVFW